MAITRAQQAKQLLAQGGRIGLQGGGRDASQADFDTPGPSGPAGDGGREDRIAGQYTSPEGKAVADRNTDSFTDKIKRFPNKMRIIGLKNKLNKFANINQIRGPLGLQVVNAFNPGDLTAQDYADIFSSPDLDQLGMKGTDLTNIDQTIDALDKAEKTGITQDEFEKAFYGPDGPPVVDDRGGGINQIIPVDTTFAQAPSITEQESEEPQGLEGLRLAFRAEGGPIGGEFDFESARQMYGLGKLVKKVTKTVKKIAKSPVGKAAILGAAGFYAGGGNLFGLQRAGMSGFKFANLPGAGLFAKSTPVKLAAGVPDRLAFNAARTAAGTSGGLGIGTLIAGTALAAGLLTPKQEEEAQALAAEEGIDIEAARNSILARAQGNTRDDFRARGFRAEGGIMRAGYQEGSKEPVAKKTMPLLDLDGKEMDLREEGGFVPIGRMEKADDVPARLSKNEFVFTADAVRNAGEGDVDKGAEVMYNMMKNLEAGGEVSEESQGLEGARKMFQTSQRLGEVL